MFAAWTTSKGELAKTPSLILQTFQKVSATAWRPDGLIWAGIGHANADHCLRVVRSMDPIVVAALIMGVVLVLVFSVALRLRKRGKQPRSKRGAPRGGGDEVQRELDARAKPSNKVREVVGLYVYPVKSCAGTSVSEAHTCVTGFENDRQWLVINEKVRSTCEAAPDLAALTCSRP